MNSKEIVKLVCGATTIAAATCGWHYWHINYVLAIIAVLVGCTLIGEAIDD